MASAEVPLEDTGGSPVRGSGTKFPSSWSI